MLKTQNWERVTAAQRNKDTQNHNEQRNGNELI